MGIPLLIACGSGGLDLDQKGETLTKVQRVSLDASIRKFNLLSLLVLFLGGYLATVLISWVVLLVGYLSNPHSPDSALSILTPASLFLVFGLQPLITPFFLAPLSLIALFALLSVKVRFKKKPWLFVLAASFMGANIAASLLFSGSFGTSLFLLAAGFYLLIWLSVGLCAVKISQRTWLIAPVISN